MNIFGIISLIIIVAILSFVFGVMGMSKWYSLKTKVQPSIEKPPTRNSIYADHVINVASRIYCNYNESKIIRLGANPGARNDRQSESLNEAFNIVNRAYAIFDKLDQDEKQLVN